MRSRARTARSDLQWVWIRLPNNSVRSARREASGSGFATRSMPENCRLNDNDRDPGVRRRLQSMFLNRRDFLKTLGGVALVALPPDPGSGHAGAAETSVRSDWCGGSEQSLPLFVPGERGFLGRLVLDDETLTLRAAPLEPADNAPAGLSQAYLASYRGREYVNPTLVLHPGQRVRVRRAP